MHHSQHRGFTLIELMVVVAVLAVLAVIAVPAYKGYITGSKIGAERSNAQSLRVFLEDYQLDNGTYVVPGSGGSYNKASLESDFGWSPAGDQDKYSYTVTATTTSWNVVVSESSSHTWVRCEDRMTKCCDSSSTGQSTPVAACP